MKALARLAILISWVTAGSVLIGTAAVGLTTLASGPLMFAPELTTVLIAGGLFAICLLGVAYECSTG